MGGWRWAGAVGHVKSRLGGAPGGTGPAGVGGFVGRGARGGGEFKPTAVTAQKEREGKRERGKRKRF